MKNWSTTQIVLTLLGVFALGAVIGYFVPPMNTWFGKPAEGGELSDCKTTDGKDGKKDADGNCVAFTSERRGFTGTIGERCYCAGRPQGNLSSSACAKACEAYL